MVNSNQKGKRGERELAAALGRIFGLQCRRGVQYQGGPDSPDVVGVPGIHVECKRTERFDLYGSLMQASSEAGYMEVPMVCHRRNNSEWVAVLWLRDIPRLVEAMQKEKTCTQD